MNSKYLLGVAVAVLCGVVNNVGVLLQKKVVSDLPPEFRSRGFMRRLLTNPLWLLGLFLQVGLGAVTMMIAQGLIGPALVPGLMASGLIVLALGSVKLIGETLNRSESIGIGLMILGILCLGLSGLDIGLDRVRAALAWSDTLVRIAVFTVSLFLLWGGIHAVSLKTARRKGIIMGFSNGFLYALSNFWISPLLAVIALVLTGKGSFGQIVIFALASLILVSTNLLAIRQIQEAFKFGQAGNIIPVQQIPIQIAPILVYFFAFALKPPSHLAGALIILGVSLIIVSGFLLGRRQAELETIL